MATILLTKGNKAVRGLKKKTLSEHVTIGVNTLVIIIIALICVVSLSYLIHSNKSSAKGYVLKQLKEEEKVLSQQESFWDLKISRAKSLYAIASSPAGRDMRKVQQFEFVRGDTAMALNK